MCKHGEPNHGGEIPQQLQRLEPLVHEPVVFQEAVQEQFVQKGLQQQDPAGPVLELETEEANISQRRRRQKEQEELEDLAHGRYVVAEAEFLYESAARPFLMEPPRRSMKERMRTSMRRRKMKKEHPGTTDTSVAMLDGLRSYRRSREKALFNYTDTIKKSGVDLSLMQAFAVPYQISDTEGVTTEVDKQSRKATAELVTDYTTCDVKRRWRHLEWMVDTVLNLQLHQGMLDTDVLERDAYQLQGIHDKLAAFHIAMEDPINKPYFDRLDDTRKEKLEAMMHWGASRDFVRAYELTQLSNRINPATQEFMGEKETERIVWSGKLQEELDSTLDRFKSIVQDLPHILSVPT